MNWFISSMHSDVSNKQSMHSSHDCPCESYSPTRVGLITKPSTGREKSIIL